MSEPKTATELMRGPSIERERMMFEQMMQSFQKRWAPDSRSYDNAQFQAELFSLVRAIYADAQRPLLKQLETHMQAVCRVSPIIMKGPADG